MELYAIVAAASIWSPRLTNRSVLFFTDNEAVVAIINRQTSKEKNIMCLVRTLVLTALRNNIMIRAKHIPGTQNILADNLSRFRLQEFKDTAYRIGWEVNPEPTDIPPPIRPDNICAGNAYKSWPLL
jgi:hypothetical protein